MNKAIGKINPASGVAPMAIMNGPRRPIRYLASEGIHAREVKGITQLDVALPPDWVFYTGLQYFPGHDTPIEMDLIILMDDRVLLVEIKDWALKIRVEGDNWVVGKRSRRGNPAKLVAAKARKLKTLLNTRLPHVPVYVDSCVILTATPEVQGLPPGESRRVLSLAQASHLGDVAIRRSHLAQLQLGLKAPPLWQYATQFDEVFGDRASFRAQEAEFDGFRVTEENVFIHPNGVWSEHRAEEADRNNSTALLRCWNFAALPPALNTPADRSFIAERERRVFDHLNALGSWLADGASVLRPINSADGDIPTDHFDLLALPATWTQVPRFVEKIRGEIGEEQALEVVVELVRIVAELHDRQIAHRDIGRRNVWIGGAARVGLTGFAISQIPSDASVADWRKTLQAYAPLMPEDRDGATKTNGFRRDVYQVGVLAREIFGAVTDTPDKAPAIPQWLEDWLTTATAADPAARFATARAMADDLARRRSENRGAIADTSRLNAFESRENPYARWPRQETFLSATGDVYRSLDAGADIVVKIWPGMRRGESLELDLALLRLLEGASRLTTSPLEGFPKYESVGLHAVGPFVTYGLVEGTPLNDLRDLTPAESIGLSSQLLRAVQSLHALGYCHGDLSPANILISGRGGAARLTIMDLFDLSAAGDGRKRTIEFCPDDHETCGEMQIDRYAAALIAKNLLTHSRDPRGQEALDQLEAVVVSSGTDLLDFPIHYLTQAAARLDEPAAPVFKVSVRSAIDLSLIDTLFTVRRFDDAIVLTTDKHELRLIMKGDVAVGLAVSQPTHRSLEDASLNGLRVRLSLEIRSGESEDLAELKQYLDDLTGLVRPGPTPRPPPTIIAPPASRDAFPVRRYWQRVIELEDALLPELEITSDGEAIGRGVTYSCERRRGTFDFDPLDTVEVFIGERNKPIGSLDLKAFGDDTVTLNKEPDWPLSKGDRVRLVSRRSRQSFDRRRRAVDRILNGESQVRDLIDYFDPSASKSAITYDIEVKKEDLEPYELNRGQEAAMMKVLRDGPVGLVQGPPGTGKTHFLAALVHWLTTKGRAEKILFVSQSHEAVNAALEKLIDRFNAEKNKLPLLRIGTKGISDKIRPYHTDALRERFRASFDGALKQRVSTAARGAGISRKMAYAAVDIERQLGAVSRRLAVLEALNDEKVDREEQRARGRMLASAQKAFASAGKPIFGRPADLNAHMQEVASAYRGLAASEDAAPADMRVLLDLLNLSQSWLSALSTRHRNFDEFLAKTRAIIAGTCVGVGQTSLRIDNNSFDWVIIDEAARCTSGELSVAAQLGRRVLLVGDHLQLLPMLDNGILQELRHSFPGMSDDVLAKSDFERAFASSYGAANHSVLSEQYRMVEPICDLVTDIFYRPHGVRLHTSKKRKADERFNDRLPEPLNAQIVWLDTSADSRAKETPDRKKSHSNEAEVAAIISLLDVIAADGEMVSALSRSEEEKPIGIICMYGAQREAVETAIAERPWEARFRRLLKVDSVDSYQGKENTIVIVSLSRTNTTRQGGHVSIPNRANVAFSRAKERLIIVGSAKFWSAFNGDDPIRKTLNWIRAREKKDGAAKVFDVTKVFAR
jgi:serine/threonine protein kinase